MQKIEFEMLAAANRADSERWTTLVSTSTMPDVYYLPAYARATSEIEHSEPVAIVASQDSGRFLAPLLLRPMSAAVERIQNRLDRCMYSLWLWRSPAAFEPSANGCSQSPLLF
jgi:hypothetical protein